MAKIGISGTTGKKLVLAMRRNVIYADETTVTVDERADTGTFLSLKSGDTFHWSGFVDVPNTEDPYTVNVFTIPFGATIVSLLAKFNDEVAFANLRVRKSLHFFAFDTDPIAATGDPESPTHPCSEPVDPGDVLTFEFDTIGPRPGPDFYEMFWDFTYTL